MIMKNQLLNLKMIALMCLMMVLGGANVWAEEEVISLANGSFANKQITWTGTSCSIIQSQNGAQANPSASYISTPRWYSGHKVSFKANEGYKIEGAIITGDKDDKNAKPTNLANSTYTNATATINGDLVEIKASGDFEIILGAQFRPKNITVLYKKNTSGPTLVASESALDFGSVENNTSKDLTFKLSGSKLTADATLSVDGEYFSVTPTSVAQTDGTIAEKDVTVSYNPTSVGPHTATLTISSTGAEDKTITLTGKSANAYTVAWSVNGKAYSEGTPTTKVLDGEKVTVLPTAPSDINGKVFVGWTSTEISGESASKPTDLFATVENAPMVSANTTYYAVYANKNGTEYWKKVTVANVNSEGEGEYALLTPDGHAFNGKMYNGGSTTTPKWHGEVTTDAFTFVNDKAETAPEGTCVLTLTKTGTNGYKMYNAEYGYLYAMKASTGNLAWHDTEDSYWSYSSSNWIYKKCNAYLRSYNNSSFRTYDKGNGKEFVFAKKVSDIAYSGYCTTVEAAAEPTYTAQTLTFFAKTSEGYYATFSNDKVTFITSKHVIPYVVTVANGKVDMKNEMFKSEKTTIESAEVDGYYIPANTGILLNSDAENVDYYTVENKIVDALAEGTNMLMPAPATTSVFTAETGYKYYKLAYDDFKKQTGLGFYWGAIDGGAFSVKAGTAYLAVTASEATAKGFTLNGEATGIEGVNANVENAKAIYNLNGQRVASMAKPGLYIVNGKKVVRK